MSSNITTTVVSEKKLAANRANARKSTGPRTPAGKQKSSQNARHHGVFCKHLLLPGESASSLEALRDLYLLRFLPHDVPELELVERIVSIAWRLRRIQAADAHLQEAHALVMKDNHFKKYGHLENPDPDDAGDNPAEFTPTPGLVIASLFHQSDQPGRPRSTPYERLLSVEQRLTGMQHRAMRELRTLQSERKKAQERDGPSLTPECPFLQTKDDLIEELKAAGELPEDFPSDDNQDDEDQHQNQEQQEPPAPQSQPQSSKLQNKPTEPPDPRGGVASATLSVTDTHPQTSVT